MKTAILVGTARERWRRFGESRTRAVRVRAAIGRSTGAGVESAGDLIAGSLGKRLCQPQMPAQEPRRIELQANAHCCSHGGVQQDAGLQLCREPPRVIRRAKSPPQAREPGRQMQSHSARPVPIEKVCQPALSKRVKPINSVAIGSKFVRRTAVITCTRSPSRRRLSLRARVVGNDVLRFNYTLRTATKKIDRARAVGCISRPG